MTNPQSTAIMSKEEKAKELIVNQFNAITGWFADWIVVWSKRKTKDFRTAKACAIIAVDEIIKVLDEISLGESGTTKMDYGQPFYEQVKKQIQLL